MSAPIDVTIVRPKHPTSALVAGLIGRIAEGLLHAFALMFAARYLHGNVSAAVPAVGYLDCLVIRWAAQLLFSQAGNPAWWYTKAPKVSAP